jgi:hypothetical protein
MIHFIPDEWQRRVIQSDAPCILVRGDRRTGKTTAAAAKAVRTLMETNDTVVLLGHDARGTLLFEERVAGMLRRAGGGHSRLVSVPPSRIGHLRGIGGRVVVAVDEAWLVGDDVYAAVMDVEPVQLVAVSSHVGRGWFAHLWNATLPGCQREDVPVETCTQIVPELWDVCGDVA